MDTMATVVTIILALAVLLLGAIFIWFYRYRFISFIRHEHTPDMDFSGS